MLESIRVTAEAKADGLLRADAQSGVPFDEAAYLEVKSEVIAFCRNEQHSAFEAIGQEIRQLFGERSLMDRTFVEQPVNGVDGIISQLVCTLEIKQDETVLDRMKLTKAHAAGLGKEKDVFISYASEDRDFVRPLAEALQESNLLVWYAEFELKVGDSLRRKIDDGLAHSRYGVVVLSKPFFEKEWPQHELDGLMSKEVASTGTKVILPVWYNISFEEIQRHSPMLSGRLATKSEEGLDAVVRKLREAMGLEIR